MPSQPTISETVRKAATEAGGVRGLARAANIEPMTVSRFINGGRIRSDHLDRLAAVLGVEVKRHTRKRKG